MCIVVRKPTSLPEDHRYKYARFRVERARKGKRKSVRLSAVKCGRKLCVHKGTSRYQKNLFTPRRQSFKLRRKNVQTWKNVLVLAELKLFGSILAVLICTLDR